jgi:hypothetical protein
VATQPMVGREPFSKGAVYAKRGVPTICQTN